MKQKRPFPRTQTLIRYVAQASAPGLHLKESWSVIRPAERRAVLFVIFGHGIRSRGDPTSATPAEGGGSRIGRPEKAYCSSGPVFSFRNQCRPPWVQCETLVGLKGRKGLERNRKEGLCDVAVVVLTDAPTLSADPRTGGPESPGCRLATVLLDVLHSEMAEASFIAQVILRFNVILNV
ncbi:hypothetical protein COCON_G00213930 [Conger conger]|uniref:Uncharacterized protein n=1 Tax=Conger conger TaxID=82655 RepID=A0A9Q1HP28_CONCO|nr:hypothetical protein COCON_G00213930 [Conger conger]